LLPFGSYRSCIAKPMHTRRFLNYDATVGQCTYNVKTEKAWADNCMELVVKLEDGTQHPVGFKFK
jgi:hypothetical protein